MAENSGYKSMTHHGISKSHRVICILHLFGEQVSKIEFSIYMLNSNKLGSDVFPDMILSHLYMTQTFRCTAF